MKKKNKKKLENLLLILLLILPLIVFFLTIRFEQLDDELNELTDKKELFHLSSLSNQLNSTYWLNQATLFKLEGHIRNDDFSQGYYDDASIYEQGGILFKDNAFSDIREAEKITTQISVITESKNNYYFWIKVLILLQIISSIVYLIIFKEDPPRPA